MLEELERRNYSAGTKRRYLRFVERFAKHFGKSPDKLGPEHLRCYQAYLLRERKLCPGTVENHVAALRFFFIRTLHRHEFRQFLPYPKVPRKLPNILSQEEVTCLINASSSLFQRTMLMVLYGTGMRRAELARLKIADIDSQRMVVHVVRRQGTQGPRPAPEPRVAAEPACLLALAQAPHLPVPLTHVALSPLSQTPQKAGGPRRTRVAPFDVE
jgi:site-specific recombinase XerD